MRCQWGQWLKMESLLPWIYRDLYVIYMEFIKIYLDLFGLNIDLISWLIWCDFMGFIYIYTGI